MIKRQIEKLGKHIHRQANYLFKKGRRKSDFIEQFIDNISPAVPLISREDIAIIATGFLSELRTLSPEVADSVLRDGK